MKTLCLIFAVFLTLSTTMVAQDYFPLTEGMTWSYSYGPMHEGGDVYQYTEKVLAEKKVINGKKYTQVVREDHQDNKVTTTTEYYRVGKNQEILVYDEDYKEDFVMVSTTVGQAWEMPFVNCRVTTLAGEITTPRATYTNCLVIEMVGGEAVMEYYFDKKLGLVGVRYQDRLVCHLEK